MRHAAEEADGLDHGTIGLVHLLLGLLRDEQSPAAAFLRAKGMELQDVRDVADQLLNAEPAVPGETGPAPA